MAHFSQRLSSSINLSMFAVASTHLFWLLIRGRHRVISAAYDLSRGSDAHGEIRAASQNFLSLLFCLFGALPLFMCSICEYPLKGLLCMAGPLAAPLRFFSYSAPLYSPIQRPKSWNLKGLIQEGVLYHRGHSDLAGHANFEGVAR